jgi:hypothetical protein
LLCRFDTNAISGGDNLLLFRNGVWFINLAADGATVDVSGPYGAPTDQPLCGSYGASGFGGLGLFRNGLWFLNASSTPTFFFGTGGDGRPYRRQGIPMRPIGGTVYGSIVPAFGFSMKRRRRSRQFGG